MQYQLTGRLREKLPSTFLKVASRFLKVASTSDRTTQGVYHKPLLLQPNLWLHWLLQTQNKCSPLFCSTRTIHPALVLPPAWGPNDQPGHRTMEYLLSWISATVEGPQEASIFVAQFPAQVWSLLAPARREISEGTICTASIRNLNTGFPYQTHAQASDPGTADSLFP
jgi:hypothetical protein